MFFILIIPVFQKLESYVKNDLFFKNLFFIFTRVQPQNTQNKKQFSTMFKKNSVNEIERYS